MRIITGSARGAKLETPEGNATRPTAERVKEAIFSMIQFDIEGREALDLFAGSGQLGLEALSRGAARATFTDTSREVTELIKRNAQHTHLFDRCRISCTDWKAFVKSSAGREKFGVIFIDPPYGENIAYEVLSTVTKAGIVADHAMLIVESGNPEPVVCAGLSLVRHARYGAVYITLLTKLPEAEIITDEPLKEE